MYVIDFIKNIICCCLNNKYKKSRLEFNDNLDNIDLYESEEEY